ncbi:MAG: hypothetical protein LBE21_03265 [Pseudomonadales bacterium]|jgi:hypothetical protein|nr:hypothetical protein [Pseudomonadales bacterium]
MKQSAQTRILFAIVLVIGCLIGCSQQLQKRVDGTASLKQSLAQLNGVYIWHADIQRYDFSAKSELEKILSVVPPKQAVGILIECLDDTSLSASILDGKRVFLGIICYEGLAQLVYYEPTDATGDIATQWPGVISPTASPQEMRNAKTEWERVQTMNRLIFQ